MNWSSIDFDWNQARAFLVTAREGSFSAAAQHLKLTQPTLSRQVAALELHLGVTLFERVGKQLAITETGKNLLEHVESMGVAAGKVTLQASGQSDQIQGVVRISAGEAICAYLLPGIVEQVRRLHPEIEIHLVAANHLSNLLTREADIAIRHVRPEQADLVAKKLMDSSAHLYAGQRWLNRHGEPQTVKDLRSADFVGAEENERFIEALSGLGLEISRDNFKWTTNSHVVGWELVRRGLGIGGMIREIADLTPEVTQVLPELPPIPVPYWLCTHREVHTSRRVRTVFDQLAKALREQHSPNVSPR